MAAMLDRRKCVRLHLEGNAEMEATVFARALTVQRNASLRGLDWDDACGVLTKIREEVDETEAAIRSGSERVFEEEVGDLLFSVVNAARMLRVDPERALAGATEKFGRRFRDVLALAQKTGRKVDEMSIAELDVLWEEAKRAEVAGDERGFE